VTPSDHEVALAFVARRQAKQAMTAARWCHLLSLELGWMNPGQARAFVEGAQRAGLLAPEGDLLRLLVDPQAVEVPRGFRPRVDGAAPTASTAASTGVPATSKAPAGLPPAAAPAPSPTTPLAGATAEPDPFLHWVSKVAAHRGTTRDQVLGQVAQVQAGMGGLLTAEAAVLLLARRVGLDVSAAAQRAAADQAKPRAA